MVAATTIVSVRRRAAQMAEKVLKLARKKPSPVCIDFESDGVEPRPRYPPKPVGVSVKYPGKPARYYGFGHVDCVHCGQKAANDCTEAEAKAALKKAYAHPDGILCQNGKFDVDVAEVHWGLPAPDWTDVHDTMFLIFLDDPNQTTFSLKPAAERILKMKPEEKDAVGEWLVKHQPVKGVKISLAQRSPTYFMKYLRFAPAPLVGRYANGDVVRTERIFDKLWPKMKRRGMLAAYERERRLMPCLLTMERQGVPIWRDRLRKDCALLSRWFTKVDAWVRSRLGCSEEVNLNSGDQLFEAMLKAKVVDRKLALRTPTGKYQTNKEALLHAVSDKALLAVLKYRAQLKTCLGTFMHPWLETADASAQAGLCSKEILREGKSLIFTSWNQVKGDARGGNVGARTGRLSSTPNFQNIPKVFDQIFDHQLTAKERLRRREEGKPPLPKLPAALRGLPALPQVRCYVAPFPGEVLIDRDFAAQEPRIMAHFDGGRILEMYKADPWMDFHSTVQKLLADAGLHYERKKVKGTSLGIMYGQGVGLLAERLDLEVEEARKLKNAILGILVGLREMYQEAKKRAAENRPVTTWGGREYYCEPPRIVDGRFRQFDYKLVNVLIQGSAADATKEAIVRYVATKPKGHRLLLNVHDQLTASVPRTQVRSGMETMRKAMEELEFDVPLLTEGSVSDESWADLMPYDKKGRICVDEPAT